MTNGQRMNQSVAPTSFLAAVCSGIEFHFDVKSLHIGIGFDDLIGFPHGDISASGRHPGDAAAILIKDNAMIGKMIGKRHGCQLADSGQRVFSHHQRIVRVNTDPHIRVIDTVDDPEHFITEGFGVIFQTEPDTRVLGDRSGGLRLVGDIFQLGNDLRMKSRSAYGMGSLNVHADFADS